MMVCLTGLGRPIQVDYSTHPTSPANRIVERGSHATLFLGHPDFQRSRSIGRPCSATQTPARQELVGDSGSTGSNSVECCVPDIRDVRARNPTDRVGSVKLLCIFFSGSRRPHRLRLAVALSRICKMFVESLLGAIAAAWSGRVAECLHDRFAGPLAAFVAGRSGARESSGSRGRSGALTWPHGGERTPARGAGSGSGSGWTAPADCGRWAAGGGRRAAGGGRWAAGSAGWQRLPPPAPQFRTRTLVRRGM